MVNYAEKICFNKKPPKLNKEIDDYEESSRHFDINFTGCSCHDTRKCFGKNNLRRCAMKLSKGI